jgi:hypothetical protein
MCVGRWLKQLTLAQSPYPAVNLSCNKTKLRPSGPAYSVCPCCMDVHLWELCNQAFSLPGPRHVIADMCIYAILRTMLQVLGPTARARRSCESDTHLSLQLKQLSKMNCEETLCNCNCAWVQNFGLAYTQCVWLRNKTLCALEVIDTARLGQPCCINSLYHVDAMHRPWLMTALQCMATVMLPI